MESFLQDVRYGLRSLAQRPGFTVVTVLTLALGIGANTAIFSVVNSVLLGDLPYRDPDRLVMIWESNQVRARDRNVVGPANYLHWRDEAKSFDDMAAFASLRANLTSVEDPEEIVLQAVTPNFFDVLGATPALGRAFEQADGVPGSDDIVLISHSLWQRRFGGSPDVVGATVHVNGTPMPVVGVMPEDFQLTLTEGALAEGRADMWTPFAFTEEDRTPRGRFLSVVGRLEEGATLEQARAEMKAISASLEQKFPDFNTAWSVTLVPLEEQVVGEVKTALLVLLGAVAFVLLIACANVANLLLMRAAVRRKEIAVRAALGASRRRVVRQLLTESVLLSVLGGLAGLAVAYWGVDLLLAMRPPEMIVLSDVGLDYRVLLFTLAVSVATGLVFGAVPALHAARTDVNESLKEGGKQATGDRGRLRQAFVVSQVALALVLLVGAGLLLRSFAALRSVDPGFDPENLLTARLQLSGSKYPEDPQRVAFFRDALERVEALPGVRSASVVSFKPFGGLGAATGYTVEGRPVEPGAKQPSCDVMVVGADYFATMGIPLVAGRDFTARELAEPMHVVVVNQALASREFPGEDPIGKRITIEMRDEEFPCTIVGVAADTHRVALDVAPRQMIYWPHPELAYNAMTLVVRAEREPEALVPAIAREVRALDPDLPLADPQTMEGVLSTSVSKARFSATLLAVFAGVAFVLAAVGIYGVLAYSVAGRSHEIAIRTALGADRRDILAMVLRQGMLMTVAGVAAGLVAALAMSRLVSSLLFGVEATDAATYAAVAAAFLAVALVACLVPARRATSVDPASALR